MSESAKKPSLQERAALIDEVLEDKNLQIDKDAQTLIRTRWAAESEERIDAVERGELKTVDGYGLFSELRALVQ
jgi:hypothetical protein